MDFKTASSCMSLCNFVTRSTQKNNMHPNFARWLPHSMVGPGCHFGWAWLVLSLMLAAHLPGHAAEPLIRVGVIRSNPIPVFETVQKGFEAGLESSGFKEGVNISFDIQNTGGDAARAEATVSKFAADKVDLVHSIGTLPSLAAVKQSRLPVVFSAVTDPASAGIVPPDSAPGKATGSNVTGITDAWPVALQLELFSKIVPGVKKWGTIYNPAEPNSVFFVELMRASAKRMGLELVEAHVNHPAQVTAAAETLTGKVKAIFTPADITVASNLQALIDFCEKHRVALFVGGGDGSREVLASYGIDYYLVGYAAGKRAALVLKGSKPGTIPWGTVDKFSLVINLRTARALGITVSPEMLRLADQVIE